MSSQHSSIQGHPIQWVWEVPSEGPNPSGENRADLILLKALETGQGVTDGVLPSLSRNQLKRLIEDGQVTLNGRPIKSHQRLLPGSQVQILFPPPLPSVLVAEDRPLHILYEDEHLVMINKPQGLTVHPSPTQMEGTLVHALLHHIKDLSGIGGVLRPGIVHRIDKNTSGVLVITKTDLAHQRLTEIFSKHEIERCYWALCYGTPSPNQGRIESLLGRNPSDRKKMSMKVKTGKKAVTLYRTLEKYAHLNASPFASLQEVTLETGRTHQIRVHLTGIGNSILGDPVYGTPTSNQPKWKILPKVVQSLVQKLPGQALHARVLGFQHPITGERIRVEAELPEAFSAVLQALRGFSKGSRFGG